MQLRPGLAALAELFNQKGVSPLKSVPESIGITDLFLAPDDECLCIMEGRFVSVSPSRRVKIKGVVSDPLVLVARVLGPKGDSRRDPHIPEDFEAGDASHVVLWSLENPEESRFGSFAKLTILEIEGYSEKSIWFSEQSGIKSVYYPII